MRGYHYRYHRQKNDDSASCYNNIVVKRYKFMLLNSKNVTNDLNNMNY